MTPDVEAFRDEVVSRRAGASTRRRSRSTSSGRRSGRTSGPGCVGAAVLLPRPDASTPTSATRPDGCGKVATTLPTRYHRGGASRGVRGYTRRRMSRASPPIRPHRPDRRRAPWGRPGDDPSIEAVVRPPDTGGSPFHDHRARRCADQRLGRRAAAVRPRRRAPQPRPRPAPRPARAAPRAHRPLPGQDGRRLRPGLHRLPRPAQPRPRPGQGRHPLPPGRHPRRGQGPRDVDDLEVRGRRHPVRRRQGRRHRRSRRSSARRSSRA